MAIGRHFENGFYRYSSAGNHPISAQLVCSCKLHFQGRSHDKVPQFCKFNRHNENRFSAISGRFIFWLTRNFVRMSIITLRHRLH